MAELKGLPSVDAEIFTPPFANHVPHLLVHYDQQKIRISPQDVVKALREGTPSIELNPASGSTHASAGLPADGKTLVVGVWMMEEGEDRIVGKRLHEVLKGAA
jgi:L-seryl-tRNA(Ser) seleniumtransferase